ncbi:MAG: hypothetical protein ACOYNS_17200 [Bacteroidota bacterium]
MLRSKKRFLYTHKIFIAIASILIALFVFPYLYWYVLPVTPLSVVVIDKTTGLNYREHKTFFWLMEHWKYVNPDTKNYYHPSTDYYGFYPEDSTFSETSQLKLDDVDILYLADTYGVYDYPMEYQQYERLIPEVYVPIVLRYGGLSSEEMDRIERYQRRGKKIIAEFNTMESPQVDVKPVQHRLEKVFGVKFTGALGRYYDDVNTASRWMKDLYQKQYFKKWDLSGRGIIITIARGLGDERPGIVVLEAGDLSNTPVFLRTTDHPMLKGTEDAVPYYYFFEFMDVDSSAKVIARYEIQCSGKGREKMIAAGLPLSFPAIILSDSTEHQVYFAGDFADNEVDVILTQYWNVEFLLSKLFSFYFVSDQTRFFWKFYLPMMKNVFNEASAERQRLLN